MREGDPSSDAKSGEAASGEPAPSVPPPSSSKAGFIGTNVDSAQAYVPPTTLPDTPEPPVPETKVALSEHVDPRKLPTYPNMKKVAQGLADRPSQSGVSERPAPIIEAPPDSQSSGIRRGAGYAPLRNHFPAPIAPLPRESQSKASRSATPARAAVPARTAPTSSAAVARSMPSAARSTTPTRSTPPAARSTTPARSTPPARSTSSDAPETPAQRSAALLLIFLFAVLLAVGAYFLMRRSPSPGSGGPASPGASAPGSP